MCESCFNDTEEDFHWLDEEFDLFGAQKKMLDEGFEEVPDDHPIPSLGYDYKFIGILAFYKKK